MHVQFLFVIMSRFRDCVLCLCIVRMKVIFIYLILFLFFLSSSLVLQVSQTHLVMFWKLGRVFSKFETR